MGKKTSSWFPAQLETSLQLALQKQDQLFPAEIQLISIYFEFIYLCNANNWFNRFLMLKF
jgi:hypothetical protein